MGIRLGAGSADDDLHPVANGIDQAAVAGRERDGEEIGIPRLAEGEGVTFRMGGEAAAEVAMQGLLLGEIDAGGLAVETDAADAAFFSEDGTTDLVITIGAGGGGGVGQAQG